MKPITFTELDSIIDMVNLFQGALVEDILFSKGVLYLGLHSQTGKPWLVIDAQSVRPGFYVGTIRPPQLKPEVKPLILFLKARLRSSELVKAERVQGYGRRVILTFKTPDGEKLEIEAHLFPQNKNILARQGKAQIAWQKPKVLSQIEEKEMPGDVRSAPQIYKEWIADKTGDKGTPLKDGSDAPKKAIIKKAKGLEKLKLTITDMQNATWKAVGDWLSLQRDLKSGTETEDLGIPEEFEKYVDHKKTLQENIDYCYSQSKSSKNKVAGALERVNALEAEIEKMKSQKIDLKKAAAKKQPSLLAEAKGRTKVFDDEITAYIGKSAADNLKLLRNAKAWYIWVHVKDIPSSHGIIALPKNKSVPDSVLREVALWVLKESLSAKEWQSWQGVKCAFLYCECRHVTPIKGDKVGRVRFKNEKVVNLLVE